MWFVRNIKYKTASTRKVLALIFSAQKLKKTRVVALQVLRETRRDIEAQVYLVGSLLSLSFALCKDKTHVNQSKGKCFGESPCLRKVNTNVQCYSMRLNVLKIAVCKFLQSILSWLNNAYKNTAPHCRRRRSCGSMWLRRIIRGCTRSCHKLWRADDWYQAYCAAGSLPFPGNP